METQGLPFPLFCFTENEKSFEIFWWNTVNPDYMTPHEFLENAALADIFLSNAIANFGVVF